MSSGQELKENLTANSDVSAPGQPKKKRLRIRNRPRNKSNVLNAAAVLNEINNSEKSSEPIIQEPGRNNSTESKPRPRVLNEKQPSQGTSHKPKSPQSPTKNKNKNETNALLSKKAEESSANGRQAASLPPVSCTKETQTVPAPVKQPQSSVKSSSSPLKRRENIKTPTQSASTSPPGSLKRTPGAQSSTKATTDTKKSPTASLPSRENNKNANVSLPKAPQSPVKRTESPTKSIQNKNTQNHKRETQLNKTKEPNSPKTALLNPKNTTTKPQTTQRPTKFSSLASTPIADNHSNEKETIKDVTIMSTPQPAAVSAPSHPPSAAGGKTREEIMAEREAKKLAKQAKKNKSQQPAGEVTTTTDTNVAAAPLKTSNAVAVESPASASAAVIAAATTDKTRDQIKAEREAKKLAKQAQKTAKSVEGIIPAVTEQLANMHISEQGAQVEEKKKPALTKAERRAIQEAQRAAKAQSLTQKSSSTKKPAAVTTTSSSSTLVAPRSVTSPPKSTNSSPSKPKKSHDCKAKLFNHLESARQDINLYVNNPLIHPTIARLGEQYAKRTIVGSNARCIAFLNALKTVIQDFETPPKKEFARSLETTLTHCVEHLQNCRPLAVSVSNAYKHIKHMLTQLPTDQPESELKNNLCRFIETYIENQIEKAAEAISCSMQKKISNGDVILTFGCSSLISYIFEEAHRRNVDFRVVVVDSRPFCEGQELLRRLTAKEIPCSYVLINAIGFIMPDVTKVLLGAHALLANGYVMARTGTAQVALVARSFNVPVLVCCETHKFSERYQTDAIVYNELGNPDDLVRNDKCCLSNWQEKGKMSPLNLMYDITPSELVTAVVTEVSILPCTSVPVILRIKPTEIGYS